jgi:hypothetical protein
MEVYITTLTQRHSPPLHDIPLRKQNSELGDWVRDSGWFPHRERKERRRLGWHSGVLHPDYVTPVALRCHL